MRGRLAYKIRILLAIAFLTVPFGHGSAMADPILDFADLSGGGLALDSGFGGSLATSDDGQWAVVGSPRLNTAAGADAGGAFIVQRPANGWSGTASRIASLSVSGLTANANFGRSVAMSGDGTVVVVGRPLPSPGQAYVFVRTGAAWPATVTPAATLTVGFEAASTSEAGHSVTISRDGTTIAIGAPAASPGRVLVFLQPVGGWTGTVQQAATLKTDLGIPGERLGSSVAMTPNGNVVVAGAELSATPPFDTGKGMIYVFHQPVAGWSGTQVKDAFLQQGNPAPVSPQFFRLGQTVAISDDAKTIVGGAPLQLQAGVRTGAAWVFQSGTGVWSGPGTPSAVLTATFAAADDGIGTAVAISADGSTILAGAPSALNDVGAVFVYRRPGPTWTSAPQSPFLVLAPRYDGAGSNFGGSVAISRDGGTVFAGAPDGGPSGQGWAYAYTIGQAPTTTSFGGVTPGTVVAGQLVQVGYVVTSTLGLPPGLVEVTDGTTSCTGTVANGKCGITFATAGPKAVLIRYLGSGPYLPSATATLITVVAPPLISGVTAEVAGSQSAIVRATVDPQFADTQVRVEWGTSPGGPYPNSIAPNPAVVPAASKVGAIALAPSPINATVAGLSPNTTYYYKVRGENVAGATTSSELSFATGAALTFLPIATRSGGGW